MSKTNPAASAPARDRARESALVRRLAGCTIGGAVCCYDELASTMDAAHALATEHAAEGTLVIAARQSGGRGRLGRAWISPEGGLYLSLILRPDRPPRETPQLSLVLGLAVAEAVAACTGLIPAIRWPNDVLIAGKKVAGILVEAKGGAVVAGLGLNVATTADQLPPEGISLAAAGAVACLVDDALEAVCRRTAMRYAEWLSDGFPPIRLGLRPFLAASGSVIRLTVGNWQVEGQAMDLDEGGRLVVRLDTGLMRSFDVGEVTLLRQGTQMDIPPIKG